MLPCCSFQKIVCLLLAISLDSLTSHSFGFVFISCFSNPLCFGQKTIKALTHVCINSGYAKPNLAVALSLTLFSFSRHISVGRKSLGRDLAGGWNTSLWRDIFVSSWLQPLPLWLRILPLIFFSLLSLNPSHHHLPPSQHSVSAVCHQVKKSELLSAAISTLNHVRIAAKENRQINK